ncbi:MAG: hypothetical protein MN733_09835, partial [Nitrososphaera sp.]|nr:hypothetical protein [Nitrososphaera sp.]
GVEAALETLPTVQKLPERPVIEPKKLLWPPKGVWQYLSDQGPGRERWDWPWAVWQPAADWLREIFPTPEVLMQTYPELLDLVGEYTIRRMILKHDIRPGLGPLKPRSMLIFAALVLTQTRWGHKNPTDWDHLIMSGFQHTGIVNQDWLNHGELHPDMDAVQLRMQHELVKFNMDEPSVIPRGYHPSDAAADVVRRGHFWSTILYATEPRKLDDPPRVLVDAYRKAGFYY